MNIAYGLYVSTNLRPCFTNQNFSSGPAGRNLNLDDQLAEHASSERRRPAEQTQTLGRLAPPQSTAGDTLRAHPRTQTPKQSSRKPEPPWRSRRTSMACCAPSPAR